MRSPPKDAARLGPGVGVGQVSHGDHITSAAEMLAAVVPGGAPHVRDYVALAVLLHYPNWAARQVKRLHPAHFTKPLHQQIARMAIAHVRLFGRTDLEQVRRLLIDSGDFSVALLDLELRILRRVADLLVSQGIVDWAANALVADRPKWRARGAA